jgi:hypothetical protein
MAAEVRSPDLDDAAGASWASSPDAFRQAAGWYVDMVGRVGPRWDEPGLGVWTVRDLVGHTSRSLLTVEAYLDKPADAVELASAAGRLPAHPDLRTHGAYL